MSCGCLLYQYVYWYNFRYMKQHILVTGGAGYIGAIISQMLIDQEYAVTIIDDLSGSHGRALPEKAKFLQGSITDSHFLKSVFQTNQFDVVIHCAAFLHVVESTQEPGKYFDNNVHGTLTLLEAMRKAGVQRIIFSSTGSVYGNESNTLLSETTLAVPINPYAASKLMDEQLLHWYEICHGFQTVTFRYFNVAGASLDGSHGEAHAIETHLIPLALQAADTGAPFSLYGTDYDTHDGTCIRDYIHVLDLVEVHLLVMKALLDGKRLRSLYNVGTGQGYSNQEIITAVQQITGNRIFIHKKPRRPGDPASLVADNSALKHDLGYTPHYSDLKTIITTAWQWHQRKNTP